MLHGHLYIECGGQGADAGNEQCLVNSFSLMFVCWTIQTSTILFMLHSYHMYSCGSVLSAEERYKIDKTAMAEAVAEEEEEAMDEEQNGGGGKSKNEGGEGEPAKEREEEEEEEKSAAIELEAILRSCDEIQQKTGGQKKAAEMEDEGLEEGEEGQTLHHNCIHHLAIHIY